MMFIACGILLAVIEGKRYEKYRILLSACIGHWRFGDGLSPAAAASVPKTAAGASGRAKRGCDSL
jgi:hypothetical protein